MRQRVLRSAAWILGETVARNLLLIAFTVALSRLLTPADFGVVGILSLFVGIASTLAEGGFGAALIQAREPTQKDISTLFWTQVALSLIMSGVLSVGGVIIAVLLDLPILLPLALAFGANILIGSLGGIHYSLFYKQMNIRPTTIAALASQMIGGLSAIALAFRGAGPWALVAQTMIATLISTLLLWLFSRWRPSFTFSHLSFRKFSQFGFSGVSIALLFEVESRVGAFAVGLGSNATSAGYYQRAASLQLMLARLLSGVVSKVAFPAFAGVKDDLPRLARALREATLVSFSLTAMAMWTMAIMSEPLVVILLGDQWTASVPLLQALCISAAFYAATGIYVKALRAIGCIRIVVMQQIIRAVAMCLVVGTCAIWGVGGMTWAQTALLIVLSPMGSIGVARHIGYRIKHQVMDLGPVVVSGVLMAAASVAVTSLLSDQPAAIRWVTVGAVSLGTYLVSLTVLLTVVDSGAWKLVRSTLGLTGRNKK